MFLMSYCRSSAVLPRILGVGHLRIDSNRSAAQIAIHEHGGADLDLVHDVVRLEQQSWSSSTPKRRGVKNGRRSSDWREFGYTEVRDPNKGILLETFRRHYRVVVIFLRNPHIPYHSDHAYAHRLTCNINVRVRKINTVFNFTRWIFDYMDEYCITNISIFLLPPACHTSSNQFKR